MVKRVVISEISEMWCWRRNAWNIMERSPDPLTYESILNELNSEKSTWQKWHC